MGHHQNINIIFDTVSLVVVVVVLHWSVTRNNPAESWPLRLAESRLHWHKYPVVPIVYYIT